jgi:hypothetical protein
MKKIRLEVDALAVQSFATAPPREARGTVVAHNTRAEYTCVYHCTFRGFTCEGDLTCGCPNTLLCSNDLC